MAEVSPSRRGGWFLALVLFAMKEVLRGRRRTASAVVGVALAVSFLAGTSIAIDSSVRAAFDSFLSRLQAEFVVSANTDRPEDLANALEAVSGVESVAPFRPINLGAVAAPGGRTFKGISPSGVSSAFAVDPARLPRFLVDWKLEGTLVLARGNAVVSRDIASDLGLSFGSPVQLQTLLYNDTTKSWEVYRFLNVTIEGMFSPPAGWRPPSFSSGGWASTFVLIHLRDAGWIEEQLYDQASHYVSVDVYMDRAALNPYDLEGGRRSIARLERALGEAAAPYGGIVWSLVSYALNNVEFASSGLRALFLAFAGPIVVLGLYVGAIGVDLAHSERRRHLAILKTRGAGPRQILGLLLLEAVVGGALAAGVGILLGVGISRFLLGSISTLFEWSPSVDIAITPTTVGLMSFFAVAFMFLVSYRSAKRTARSAVVETLRYYVPGETRIAYRPTMDLLFLGVGVGSVGLFLARETARGAFAFFVDPLPFVLLPFAPFLIAVGLTRLTTRSTPKAYSLASRVAKPFTGALHTIVARNLGRNPRRASSIAVVLALGLAFGIMSLSTLHGELAWEDRQVRAALGADLSVVPPADDPGFAGNLSALIEISGTTSVRTLPLATLEAFPPEAYVLDPSSYFDITKPEAWFFLEGGLDSARDVLSTPGRVLVSQGYRDRDVLDAGDSLTLSYSVTNKTTQVQETRDIVAQIGGVVRALPGTGRVDSRIFAIYGSATTFRLDPSEIAGSVRVLVALKEGSDWRTAKQAILDLGATDVTAYEEARAAARGSPIARAFLEFMGFQSAFLIGIVVGGLVLITFAASLERDVEFAGIMARGASGWQTAALLLGEALSIIVLGVLVGTLSGLLAAYVFATVVVAGPGGQASAPVIPFPFVVPLEAALLIAGAAGTLILASLLVSWRIAHMDVPRVLRRRAG